MFCPAVNDCENALFLRFHHVKLWIYAYGHQIVELDFYSLINIYFCVMHVTDHESVIIVIDYSVVKNPFLRSRPCSANRTYKGNLKLLYYCYDNKCFITID